MSKSLNIENKVCAVCKKYKPILDFKKNSAYKSGIHNKCKSCDREYFRKIGKIWYNRTKETRRIKNREKYKKYKNRGQRALPYFGSYNNAKTRCNNPNCKDYSRYGGKGVKFLMTLEDFKFLWNRDKAYKLHRPSIDRIDSDGNYELDNCRFIEHIKNCSRMYNK